MKVLIVGLIVLALGVAGVSTYLIKSFSSKEAISELEKEAEPIKTRILVATKALAPGDVIMPDAMKWVPWPEESMHKNYIVIEKDDQMAKRQKELVDSVVRIAIKEGEPLLADKMFKRDKAGFMAGMLNPGMRAMAIPVTLNNAVSGFILPNDRVDLLLLHDGFLDIYKEEKKEEKRLENERKREREAAAKAKQAAQQDGAGGKKKPKADPDPAIDRPKAIANKRIQNIVEELGGRRHIDKNLNRYIEEAFPPTWYIFSTLGRYIIAGGASETILKNIRVIAVNQSVTPPEGISIPPKTVTLEVSPKQAEIITAARAMGKVSLVLRGIGPEGVDTSPKTTTTDVDVSPLFARFKEENEKFADRLKEIYAIYDREKAKIQAKAKQNERLKRTAKKAEETPRQNKMAIAPIAPITPAPAITKPTTTTQPAKKAKKPVVKIYRGGAAKTEEIQTK